MPFQGHLEDIIMPMAMGVVAFSEDRPILFIRKGGIMETMGGGKTIHASEIDHGAFTSIFSEKIRVLKQLNFLQTDMFKAAGHFLPDKSRQGFKSRPAPAQLGDFDVDMAVIELLFDLLPHDAVDFLDVDDPVAILIDRAGDSHTDIIIMPMRMGGSAFPECGFAFGRRQGIKGLGMSRRDFDLAGQMNFLPVHGQSLPLSAQPGNSYLKSEQQGMDRLMILLPMIVPPQGCRGM